MSCHKCNKYYCLYTPKHANSLRKQLYQPPGNSYVTFLNLFSRYVTHVINIHVTVYPEKAKSRRKQLYHPSETIMSPFPDTVM